MNKPQIADYVEMPRSTTTGVNINYRAYSCALEQYINHLESEVKNLNIQRVINCKPDIKAALNGAVKAIYFADNSDYLSGLYEVVCSLTNLDEPTDKDIKMLYNELNPD